VRLVNKASGVLDVVTAAWREKSFQTRTKSSNASRKVE
jgi:hypothetical protein